MSSQGTRKNRQAELQRPLGAGPTPQANAEVLLAELKRLLKFQGMRPSLHRRLPLRSCLRRVRVCFDRCETSAIDGLRQDRQC